MKKIKWVIFFVFIAVLSYGVVPHNERTDDFEAKITTVVSSKGSFVLYHYKINYSSANKRRLTTVTFGFPLSMGRSEFVRLDGMAARNIKWLAFRLSRGMNRTYLSFYPRGKRGVRPEPRTWINKNMRVQFNKNRLNPRETLNLYVEVKGKYTIPGVAIMEGYCNQATWVFEDAGLAPRSFDPGFRSKKFKVIGPVPKPVGILPMIEKLIEITTGSRKQKWITKQGIYNGLLAKLNAAKNNIIKGSSYYHTASNILKAFNYLLSAQRKKAITDSCYQMLLYNSNLLIKRLQ